MATTSPNERGPTFRDLLVGLGQDVSALVHDEIDLLKKETRSELRTSFLVLGIAGVLAVAAVLTLCAAAVLALARVLDPVWAALVVGGGVAVVALCFAIAAHGWRQRAELRPQLHSTL